MKYLAVTMLALYVMLAAACSPMTNKATELPDDDLTEGTAGRMRQMEQEMREGDKQIGQPNRGFSTP